MRGATGATGKDLEALGISIHAPHAGCDRRSSGLSTICKHFNPRTPCGVRLRPLNQSLKNIIFQSTHPMRGATLPPKQMDLMQDISIHAPHAGCDFQTNARKNAGKDFNPRTPCGVRQRSWPRWTPRSRFQSTHPMRGATGARGGEGGRKGISIHAPHAGCDPFIVISTTGE